MLELLDLLLQIMIALLQRLDAVLPVLLLAPVGTRVLAWGVRSAAAGAWFGSVTLDC